MLVITNYDYFKQNMEMVSVAQPNTKHSILALTLRNWVTEAIVQLSNVRCFGKKALVTSDGILQQHPGCIICA